MKRPIFLAVAVILAITGCTNEKPENLSGNETGYVMISSSIDQSVIAPVTKSDDDAIAVTIYDSKNNQVWSIQDMAPTERVELPTGSYTADAISGSESAAAFDSPFYSCRETFSVTSENTTYIDLVLTLEATKVTASFSEDFSDYFSSFELTVSNGSGSLAFNSGTKDMEGYFSVTGLLSCSLALVTDDGQSFFIPFEYTDVSAREYYSLMFTLVQTSDGFRVTVNDSTGEKSFDIAIEDNATISATSVIAWARFADLTGSWTDGRTPSGLGFEYRVQGGSWKTVAHEVDIDEETQTFSTELRGLNAETAYEFRVVSSKSTSDAVAFTTEAEGSVPNLNFDSWYDAGKYWSPNESENDIIWDTANPGTSSMGVVPTSREEDHLAVTGNGKYAAKLESMAVLNSILAAGNLYTGQYVSTSGLGAKLNWGYPFTARPIALKGYFDYRPAIVDMAKDPYTDQIGQWDVGSIQILLTSWSEPFEINTSSKVFVDYEDSSIIAIGSLELEETSDYTEFTIKLDYRDKETVPTYIVIVCAASRYGDYFTGGRGSVLYVDEFSLIYDPDEID